jgi:Tfp pilus assembly protein PilX
MRLSTPRLRDEQGIALVLVIIIGLVLTTVSAVLVTALVNETSRSSHSVVRQQSFQAAEAGLNSYASKLIEDGLFYSHYVAPGESTRKDPVTSNLVTAGNPWPYGLAWTYPNGHDWVSTAQLPNNYEYSLQITPPSAAACATPTSPLCGAITIVATGRPHADANTQDWREVEATIRPSSISDYYRIVNGDVAFGSTTTTNGKVYAAGNITHDGTANANLYAGGKVTGSVSYGSGATHYDSTTNPKVSQVVPPLNFSSFLASVSTISAVAKKAGTGLTNTNGQYFDTSTVAGVVTNTQKNYPAWVLTFNTNGTFSIKACKPSSGSDPAAGASPMSTCSSTATFNVPTNGAIYSPQTIVVLGTVVGRVTIGSGNDIDIGGVLNPKTSGTDVLGLVATNDVYIAQYVPSTLTWSAAICVINGTWQGDKSDGSHNTMNFTGSSTTANGGDMTMFDTRNYDYDPNLLKLPPPWFPQLQAYTTVFFRELPPS